MRTLIAIIAVAFLVGLVLADNEDRSRPERPERPERPDRRKRYTVGFVIPVDRAAISWGFSFERARQWVKETYSNVDTPFIVVNVTAQNVCDQTCYNTILSFIDSREFNMIVMAGTPFSAHVDRWANDHPDIFFYQTTSIPGTLPRNLCTFFGFTEQARYLSGYLAGLTTENNQVAYAFEVNAVYTIKQFNAFYAGVMASNPNANVSAMNINSINNADNDRIAIRDLLARTGADVIGVHNAYAHGNAEACMQGVKSVGYGSNIREYVGDSVLTSAEWNWNVALTEFIGRMMDRDQHSQNFFGALQDNGVILSPLSPLVPNRVARRVNNEKAAIIAKGYRIFCGPLFSTFGPGADGCINLAQFSKITTILPGANYLGNADLSGPVGPPLSRACFRPPVLPSSR